MTALKTANLHYCLKIQRPIRILILFCISAFATFTASAQQGSFDGTTLAIPVVAVGELYYSVELTLVGGIEPPTLELTLAEEVEEPESGPLAFYRDLVLTVPAVSVSGVMYWGRFSLVQESPPRFQLSFADLDDEDDDNDEINDDTDNFPLVPIGDPDPLNIAGIWNFNFTVTAVQGEACAGEVGETLDVLVEIEYDADLDLYIVSGEGLAFLPDYTDKGKLVWSGTGEEDGGITSSVVSFTIISGNSLAGLENWSWSQGGQVLCTNGRTNITGTR